MLLAVKSAKLSAQSPPCSRKASPLATLASAPLSLRASPANTNGGERGRRASWPAHDGRVATQRGLGAGQRGGVRIDRHLLGTLAPPTRQRPVCRARAAR